MATPASIPAGTDAGWCFYFHLPPKIKHQTGHPTEYCQTQQAGIKVMTQKTVNWQNLQELRVYPNSG